ncbi:proline-rich extensin-like protein EPR1 [Salmo trutta]|uniref:proline-rich extensin-like protein EPR1 n=1 Tax=Salmo trutta TaxID=8032 RepID=UPI0011310BB6|nr:proline-rich extensin-like protein EPR1 [Salmo trutta]
MPTSLPPPITHLSELSPPVCSRLFHYLSPIYQNCPRLYTHVSSTTYHPSIRTVPACMPTSLPPPITHLSELSPLVCPRLFHHRSPIYQNCPRLYAHVSSTTSITHLSELSPPVCPRLFHHLSPIYQNCPRLYAHVSSTTYHPSIRTVPACMPTSLPPPITHLSELSPACMPTSLPPPITHLSELSPPVCPRLFHHLSPIYQNCPRLYAHVSSTTYHPSIRTVPACMPTSLPPPIYQNCPRLYATSLPPPITHLSELSPPVCPRLFHHLSPIYQNCPRLYAHVSSTTYHPSIRTVPACMPTSLPPPIYQNCPRLYAHVSSTTDHPSIRTVPACMPTSLPPPITHLSELSPPVCPRLFHHLSPIYQNCPRLYAHVSSTTYHPSIRTVPACMPTSLPPPITHLSELSPPVCPRLFHHPSPIYQNCPRLYAHVSSTTYHPSIRTVPACMPTSLPPPITHLSELSPPVCPRLFHHLSPIYQNCPRLYAHVSSTTYHPSIRTVPACMPTSLPPSIRTVPACMPTSLPPPITHLSELSPPVCPRLFHHLSPIYQNCPRLYAHVSSTTYHPSIRTVPACMLTSLPPPITHLSELSPPVCPRLFHHLSPIYQNCPRLYAHVSSTTYHPSIRTVPACMPTSLPPPITHLSELSPLVCPRLFHHLSPIYQNCPRLYAHVSSTTDHPSIRTVPACMPTSLPPPITHLSELSLPVCPRLFHHLSPIYQNCPCLYAHVSSTIYQNCPRLYAHVSSTTDHPSIRTVPACMPTSLPPPITHLSELSPPVYPRLFHHLSPIYQNCPRLYTHVSSTTYHPSIRTVPACMPTSLPPPITHLLELSPPVCPRLFHHLSPIYQNCPRLYAHVSSTTYHPSIRTVPACMPTSLPPPITHLSELSPPVCPRLFHPPITHLSELSPPVCPRLFHHLSPIYQNCPRIHTAY